jgi:alkylation response protein AidB-like acyl-CoA dehydrogenase
MDASSQDEVRDVARRLLHREAATSWVRSVERDPGAVPDRLWDAAVRAGWTGIVIPEEFGGGGGGFVELGVVLTEVGRALAPGPFLGSVVLGTAALLAAPFPHRQRWLPALAAGEARVTAGPWGAAGRPGEIDLTARRDPAGWTVDGVAAHVPDADLADALVLAASDATGEPIVLLAERGAAGLDIALTPTHDLTRRLGRVTADGLRLPPDSELARGRDALELIDTTLAWGAAAIACDSLGVAERVLEDTVSYVGGRIQFGRPIGTFQAVKHRCTDMFIAVESSRVLVDDAVRAIAGDVLAAGAAASSAKSYAADAAAKVAGDGVQLHGGIGYTWEHDLHLCLKRAKLNQALVGSSRWHRRRLADLVLG